MDGGLLNVQHTISQSFLELCKTNIYSLLLSSKEFVATFRALPTLFLDQKKYLKRKRNTTKSRQGQNTDSHGAKTRPGQKAATENKLRIVPGEEDQE
jgi:hypothetical protein